MYIFTNQKSKGNVISSSITNLKSSIKSSFGLRLRAISLALLLSFFAQDLCWALPEIKAPDQASWARKFLPIIPEAVATLEGAWKGGDKTVILIEDAHANASGQLNLAKALDLILKSRHPERSEGSFLRGSFRKDPSAKERPQDDIFPVFVEGGFGDEGISELRVYGTAEKRRQVGQKYLRKGLLHGEEFLDLTSERLFRILGVEDADLYRESVELYKKAMRQRPDLEIFLNRMDVSLRTLESEILNPWLAEHMNQHRRFQAGQISTLEYLDGLVARARTQGISIQTFPNLRKLQKLRLLDREPLKSSVRGRAHAARVTAYLKKTKAFDYHHLLDEQANLESLLLETMMRSEDERQFVACAQMLESYRKMLHFQMDPDSYRAYQKLKKDRVKSQVHLTAFLNEKIKLLGRHYERSLFLEPKLDALVSTAEQFYELTLKRDEKFVENIQSNFSGSVKNNVGVHNSTSVLIAGGYHTPNVTALLKAKNISYIILRPQVYQPTNIKLYESLLAGQSLQLPSFATRPAPVSTVRLASVRARGNFDKLRAELAGSRLSSSAPTTLPADPSHRNAPESTQVDKRPEWHKFFGRQRRLAENGTTLSKNDRTEASDSMGVFIRELGVHDAESVDSHPDLPQGFLLYPDLKEIYSDEIVDYDALKIVYGKGAFGEVRGSTKLGDEGVVYKFYDLSKLQKFILGKLPKTQDERVGVNRYIQNEALNLVRLRSYPELFGHFPQILNVGFHEGMFWIKVKNLPDSVNLEQALGDNLLTAIQKIDTVIDLIKTLQMLRERKIVHADVKAKNILVRVSTPGTADNKVTTMLIDYGTAVSDGERIRFASAEVIDHIDRFSSEEPKLHLASEFTDVIGVVTIIQQLFVKKPDSKLSEIEQRYFKPEYSAEYEASGLDDISHRFVTDLSRSITLKDVLASLEAAKLKLINNQEGQSQGARLAEESPSHEKEYKRHLLNLFRAMQSSINDITHERLGQIFPDLAGRLEAHISDALTRVAVIDALLAHLQKQNSSTLDEFMLRVNEEIKNRASSAARLSTTLRAGVGGMFDPENRKLFDELLKADQAKFAQEQAEKARSSKASESKAVNTDSPNPTTQKISSEAFKELAALMSQDHGDSSIENLIPLNSERTHWVSMGGGGKAFEYRLGSDNRFKQVPQDESLVSSEISRSYGTLSIFNLIPLNSERTHWVSVGYGGKAFEYRLGPNNRFEEVPKSESLISSEISKSHGTSAIFNLIPLNSEHTHWISVGGGGKAFEYRLGPNNRFEEVPQRESLISSEISRSYGTLWIHNLIPLNSERTHWVSVGSLGHAFEYRLGPDNRFKQVLQDKSLISSEIIRSHGDSWIYNLIPLNSERTHWVSVGSDGNAFEYRLGPNNRFEEVSQDKSLISSEISKSHDDSWIYNLIPLNSEHTHWVSVGGSGEAFAYDLSGLSKGDAGSGARLAARSIGPLLAIQGYKNFFTQNIDGREYVAFRRGMEITRWERGPGGAQVPSTLVEETDENVDHIVSIFNVLYRPGTSHASFSQDGGYYLHEVQDGLIELLEKSGSGWASLKTFNPSSTTPETKPDIRTRTSPLGDFKISLRNGSFEPVSGWAQADGQAWQFHEDSTSRVLAFEASSQSVRVLTREGGAWTVSQTLSIDKDTRGTAWDGKYAELIGETGLGKDEIILAAAHILNQEVYFMTGNSDVDVEEVTTAFREVGASEEGSSGFDPAPFNKAMQRGAWYVIREAHKLRPGVLNSFKSHITAKDHKWPVKRDGLDRLETVRNHPRARLLSTVNRIRPGITGTSTENNSPMQDRKELIEFYWNKPANEARWQLEYALSTARRLGKYAGDDKGWSDFKSRLELDIAQLVAAASDLRLTFAGYSAAQQAAIHADWGLLQSGYLARRMGEDPKIKKLFENGPENPRGTLLKRPPSPRVIKSIIRHFVRFEADRKYRALSVIKGYYNFHAELDLKDSYRGAIARFERHFSNQAGSDEIVLNEKSFKVSGDSLVITPVGAKSSTWEPVRVPLHPEASIRTKGLPDEVADWIQSPVNALKFYQHLQCQELGMDVIFVGKPGSGKSTMTEAIQKLLNAPGKLKFEINEETQAQHLTYQRDMKEFKTVFSKEALPYAMDDGKAGQVINLDESTQGRPGMLSLLNEVSERRLLPDPGKGGDALRARPGFQIIHTINPPASADRLKSFPDDFIERHFVIRFDTLDPAQALTYLLEATSGETFPEGVPIRVNPRLLGERVLKKGKPIKDSSGQEVYSGLLGVWQEINRRQEADPSILPKGREISFRVFQTYTKNIFDRYAQEEAKGLKAQDILLDLFYKTFTLEGEDKKLISYRSMIREAFASQKLWAYDAAKPQSDAVSEFLDGESVLVQELELLQAPHTKDDELDRALAYLQTNVAGSGVRRQIEFISKKIANLIDPATWLSKPTQQKLLHLDMLIETYRILDIILARRGDQTKGVAHGVENKQAIDDLKAEIRRRLIAADWDLRILTAKGFMTDKLPEEVQVIQTGHPGIDQDLLKQLIYSVAGFSKKDEAELNESAQQGIMQQYSAIPNPQDRIVVGKKLQEFMIGADKKMKSQSAARLSTTLRAGVGGMFDPENRKLFDKILEADQAKFAQEQAEKARLSKASESKAVNTDSPNPTTQKISFEAFKELAALMRQAHRNASIYNPIPLNSEHTHWVSVGSLGEAHEYHLSPDNRFKEVPQDESLISSEISRSYGTSFIYNLIPLNSERTHWLSVGEWGKAFEYRLGPDNRFEEVPQSKSLISSEISRSHGSDSWIINLIPLNSERTHWVSVGNHGKAFEYRLGPDNRFKEVPQGESLISSEISRSHGTSGICNLIPLNSERTHWVSVGEGGKAFEYRLGPDNRFKQVPQDKSLISSEILRSHGTSWIYNLIPLNSEHTHWISVGYMSVGYGGKVFEYRLGPNNRFEEVPYGESLISSEISRNHGISVIYNLIPLNSEHTHWVSVGDYGKAFAYDLSGARLSTTLRAGVGGMFDPENRKLFDKILEADQAKFAQEQAEKARLSKASESKAVNTDSSNPTTQKISSEAFKELAALMTQAHRNASIYNLIPLNSDHTHWLSVGEWGKAFEYRLGPNNRFEEVPQDKSLISTNFYIRRHDRSNIYNLIPLNSERTHWVSLESWGKAFELGPDNRFERFPFSEELIPSTISRRHGRSCIYNLIPLNSERTHWVSMGGNGNAFEYRLGPDNQFKEVPQDESLISSEISRRHGILWISNLIPLNSERTHWISVGSHGKAFEYRLGPDNQFKEVPQDKSLISSEISRSHGDSRIYNLIPLNSNHTHWVSVGDDGKAFEYRLGPDNRFKEVPYGESLISSEISRNHGISVIYNLIPLNSEHTHWVSVGDYGKAFAYDLSGARLSTTLRAGVGGMFDPEQKKINEYYELKKSLTFALDSKEIAKAKAIYHQWLSRLDEFAALAQTIQDPVLKRELAGLAYKSFSAEEKKLIFDVADSVSRQLFDDIPSQKRLAQEIVDSVKTYHLSQYVSEHLIEKNTDVAAELVAQTGLSIGRAGGIFNLYTKSIHLQSDPDLTLMRSMLTHEVIHYLADRKLIKIPAEWEEITHAVQVMESAADLEVVAKYLGEPMLKALFERGKQMGQTGKTGFILKPGVSDRKAGYFSTELLVAEAKSVYESQGFRADTLNSAYASQRAAGFILAGILSGMTEKDSNLKPLSLLRDFFELLYERYGNVLEDDPELAKRIENIMGDVKSFVTASTGQRTQMKPLDLGLWRFRDSGDFAGELSYVATDLYPRTYDGADKDDREGQIAAARERALGHALLAVSKVKHGLHELQARLTPETREHPALAPLWDTLLLPKSAGISLDVHLKGLKRGSIESRYQGAGRWVARLFQDRYQIGNALVEEALLLSNPLHLQYLDSLLYRRFHYDPKEGNIRDPRVRNTALEEAVARTVGSVDDADQAGWAKLLYTPDALNEDQIVKAVGETIWPVYRALYDQAVTDEQRWRAYQRKMKEEKKEALRKEFEKLTKKELQGIDDYLQSIPEKAKEAIERAVEELMDNAAQNFGAGGSGSKSKSGSSQGRGPRSLNQSPGSNSQDLGEQIQDLKQAAQELSEQIDQMAQGLGQFRENSKNPGDSEKAAQELQNQSAELLDKGREIAQGAAEQENQIQKTRENLASPEEGDKASEVGAAVDHEAKELLNQLKELNRSAADLKSKAQRLAATSKQRSPDSSQIGGQKRALEESIENLQDQAKKTAAQNKDLERLTHELENELNGLHQEPGESRGSEGAPALESPGAKKKSPKSPREEKAKNLPDKLVIPGATDFKELLQNSSGKSEREHGAKVHVPEFDPVQAALDEDERLTHSTGLNQAERAEYQSWLKIRLESGKRAITVEDLIQDMTRALEVLALPAVDVEFQGGMQRGPILDDVVAVLLGEPGYGKWRPSEPLPIKLSFLVDTSGSMGQSRDNESMTPIEIARIMTFALASALLNHNEERERRGYQPAEFEVALFSDVDDLLISHNSVRQKNFRRERLLYNLWNRIQASGGTNYANNLHHFTERLLSSKDLGEKSTRVLVALTDEDVSPDQQKKVLATINMTEEQGAKILIVPLGSAEETSRTLGAHRDHLERIVTSRPLTKLPLHLMTALANSIKPPAPGRSWLENVDGARLSTTLRAGVGGMFDPENRKLFDKLLEADQAKFAQEQAEKARLSQASESKAVNTDSPNPTTQKISFGAFKDLAAFIAQAHGDASIENLIPLNSDHTHWLSLGRSGHTFAYDVSAAQKPTVSGARLVADAQNDLVYYTLHASLATGQTGDIAVGFDTDANPVVLRLESLAHGGLKIRDSAGQSVEIYDPRGYIRTRPQSAGMDLVLSSRSLKKLTPGNLSDQWRMQQVIVQTMLSQVQTDKPKLLEWNLDGFMNDQTRATDTFFMDCLVHAAKKASRKKSKIILRSRVPVKLDAFIKRANKLYPDQDFIYAGRALLPQPFASLKPVRVMAGGDLASIQPGEGLYLFAERLGSDSLHNIAALMQVAVFQAEITAAGLEEPAQVLRLKEIYRILGVNVNNDEVAEFIRFLQGKNVSAKTFSRWAVPAMRIEQVLRAYIIGARMAEQSA